MTGERFNDSFEARNPSLASTSSRNNSRNGSQTHSRNHSPTHSMSHSPYCKSPYRDGSVNRFFSSSTFGASGADHNSITSSSKDAVISDIVLTDMSA